MPEAARYGVALGTLVSASAIALLDWLVGPVPDLTVLYVAPIAVATVFVGIPFGLFVAVLSAVLRVAVELLTGTFFGARSLIAGAFHLVAHVLVVLVIGYVDYQMAELQRSRARAEKEAEDLRRAQQELGRKDQQIRETYSNVMEAVTGGKLILVTPKEFSSQLGRALSEPEAVSSPDRIGEARKAIAQLLSMSGLEPRDKDALLLASSEALTNAVKHGRDASYRVSAKDSSVEVSITDHGPGIAFETLPHATLSPGFSTTEHSLGIGFTIMLSVCDQVYLSTQSGLTEVGLEMTVAK